MDQSTSNDLGKKSPKKIREVELATPCSQKLIEIKEDFIKIVNNAEAEATDYFQVRKIRLKLKRLLVNESLFSRSDRNWFKEIKIIFARLKRTHPELCSKGGHKKISSFSQMTETEFEQSIVGPTQNTSRNIVSSFVSNTPDTPTSEQVQQENMRKAPQQTPVADETDVGCSEKLTEDEVHAKIRQYKVWALELINDLEQRDKTK